ncbi:MAG TPA: DUF5615 family PIN-like protein [Lacipirellulaceae bacterium]|jgi:hypothetical protein
MLQFLSDENFNNDLSRGLLLRNPAFDLTRVQDEGLTGAEDATILAWAAQNGRIVLTHDRRTFPHHANRRVEAGDAMPGVFVVNDRLPLRPIIDELLLIDSCSKPAEWWGIILFLPL